MKKLLYICPHLSTGGQPQYAYKQIQHFIKDFIIEVVEINSSGGNDFIVQKNKIKKIVNLHALQEDKLNLISIIDEFQPDIIHFQEIPEYDLPLNLLDIIFSQDRKYFIIVTTHGSKTDPSRIVYQPDKYVLVSEWSKKKFEQANLGVPIEVWEYPIEEFNFDKNSAQKDLNFDQSYEHILMVGLFTSGKNQGEIFSIARQLEKYKIKFHFVGNQAGNHKDYWSPLMKDKPSNCIVWGERDDVDKFYQACDLFYFSSKLELNPLSIKEAISYKMPCIFRKLETYLNTYDDHPLVTYIDDDLKNTKRIILEKLNPEFYENIIYDNLIKNLNSKKDIDNIFDFSFVDGAKIKISGRLNQQYEVLFIDAKTNNLIYKSNIKNNMWAGASPKYFINWKLQIKKENQIISEKNLDLKNKKVKILLDTRCLGDVLAYVGSVIEFQKQHNCIVDCIILNEELKKSISEANPSVNFYSKDIQDDYYACYKINYRLEDWKNHIPINPKLLSLTQIAPTILGLTKKEYKIKLSYAKEPKPEKPYICIAAQSTAQAKYWNNESGWEKLIKYLNERGYDVWCIDKSPMYGNPKRKMNFIPKGAIDKTGDLPIEQRMSQISNAKFFIGLGSGLSWLAWNVGVPVVLISGFSEKWAEFETPYRIINENVCHGCWNKEQHTFDKGDWMWCPENKNFECTKSITPEMVVEKINNLL